MQRILLVEDDPALGRGLARALSDHDRQVTLRESLASGLEALAAGEWDLLVLDVNLPDGSGLDILRRARALGRTPAILLTANDMELDEVEGLEAGADDYITKPFSLAVLRARVNAQLRRAASETLYEIDGLRFDFERMEFSRNGAPLELSRTEQRLLRLLVENRGRVLPRDLLIDRLWGSDPDGVEENALSVAVKRLRDKLEADPAHPRWIQTAYGVGYGWKVK